MAIKVVSDKQLLLTAPGKHVFYKKGALFIAEMLDGPHRFLCRIPQSKRNSILSRICLTERMLRLMPRAAAWIDADSFLFAHKGAIYRVELQTGRIEREHTLLPGMSAPLSFTQVNNVADFDDGIVYGNYVGERNADISVWHRSKDGVWKNLFRFPQGSVLHIHQIVSDPEQGRLLILTGDADNEAGIWEARDNFRTVTPVLLGSQQYRSCFAFLKGSSIFYATDTPLERNYLYEYNPETEKTAMLCELPGPVIYGAVISNSEADNYLLATSVEPDSRKHGIRYLLSYKRGEGVLSPYSCLFYGNPETGFRQVARFKKDILPMALFQFGNALFPSGKLDRIYACPQSVWKYHGKTIEIEGVL